MISVRIDSNRPIFIEADAKSFGEVFARANSEEQAEILKAMCEGLAAFPMQEDYIAIELEREKYKKVRDLMLYLAGATTYVGQEFRKEPAQ